MGAALLLCGAGCATGHALRAHELNLVQPGDAMETVRHRLGEPSEVVDVAALGEHSGRTVWIYTVADEPSALPAPIGLRRPSIREELTGIPSDMDTLTPPPPQRYRVAITFIDGVVTMIAPSP